jgi:hypothetical protein
MASMGRTRLLTGEDAEIRSVQDGAKPSSNKNFSPKGWPNLRHQLYSQGLWIDRRFKKESFVERQFKGLKAGSI